jgi:hypothetical protein
MPPPEPGRTRTCPHCKSTILESADKCPACHHHLRFGADAGGAARSAQSLFRVEGSMSGPTGPDAWEYDVVVALYDEKGAEIARKVVHVGALRPTEARRCVVSIDAYPAAAATDRRPPVPPPVSRLAARPPGVFKKS